MAIIRAYRDDEEGLSFREAWYDEETAQFVVNRGPVGRLSETPVVEDDLTPEAGEGLLAAFAESCEADGYRELGVEEQSWMHVRFPLKHTEPQARDRSLRDAVVSGLTGHLAWRGLGTLEASVFGASGLTITVLTPAPKLALKAALTSLRESARSDVNRAVIAVAPGTEPAVAVVKQPQPYRGGFTVDAETIEELRGAAA
ncbi:MAG: hypothetical protein ACTII7_07920 [Galactobacter sp.]